MQKILFMSLTLFAASTAPANAQTGAPQSRLVPITFNGFVADDGFKSIRIRQPDGTSAPYAGPMPDIAYKVGDTFTITFNANLPTKAFYEYVGQVSADGIYRIGLTTASAGFGGVGYMTTPQISGAIRGVPAFQEPPLLSGLAVIYNANTDSYSLDTASAGRNWIVGTVDGPGYTYDPNTGVLSKAASSCLGGSPIGCSFLGGGYAILGNQSGTSTSNILISSAEGANSAVYGAFNLGLGGSWNLPWYGGNPTAVPAPGMAWAFGVGALALMRRRKRKAA